MKIEAKKISIGAWVQISIVAVEYGFSKTLQGNKWVNTTDEPQRFETEILTLGKCFNGYDEAEKFMSTKAFKQFFAAVEKTGLKMMQ